MNRVVDASMNCCEYVSFMGNLIRGGKFGRGETSESIELQRRDVKVYRPADIIMELKSLPVLLCIFPRNKTETRYPDALTLTLPLKLELLCLCLSPVSTLLWLLMLLGKRFLFVSLPNP
jgi:hypothetical protein